MTTAIGIISLLVAATLLMGALFRPGWALAAIMLLFPLEQVIQSSLPFFSAYGKFFNFSVGIAALLSLLVGSFRGDPVFRGYFNGTTVAVLGLYTLGLVSFAWSPQHDPVLELVLFYLPPIILAIGVAPLLPRRTSDLADFARAYLVFGLVVALLVLFNPASRNVWGRTMLDIGTGKSNPLALSEHGALLLLVAVFYRPVHIAGAAAWATVRVSAILFGAALLFQGGARGQALIAGAVAFLFWPMARHLKNVLSFLGAGIAMAAVGGLGTLGLQLFLVAGSERRWSASRVTADVMERVDAASALFSAFLSNPSKWFLGLGIGAYATIDNSVPFYVHNLVVECLCELGFLGFALWAAAISGGVIACRRLWLDRRHDPNLRWPVALVAASCFMYFMLSLKQGSLWGDYKLFMFAIIAARLKRVETAEDLAELAPDASEEAEEEQLGEEIEPVTGA